MNQDLLATTELTYSFAKIMSHDFHEYTNTNLYFKEKGALLNNILAHQNVSLNSKYPSILGSKIKEKYNISQVIKSKNNI